MRRMPCRQSSTTQLRKRGEYRTVPGVSDCTGCALLIHRFLYHASASTLYETPYFIIVRLGVYRYATFSVELMAPMAFVNHCLGALLEIGNQVALGFGEGFFAETFCPPVVFVGSAVEALGSRDNQVYSSLYLRNPTCAKRYQHGQSVPRKRRRTLKMHPVSFVNILQSVRHHDVTFVEHIDIVKELCQFLRFLVLQQHGHQFILYSPQPSLPFLGCLRMFRGNRGPEACLVGLQQGVQRLPGHASDDAF